jgi:hypothetical protein
MRVIVAVSTGSPQVIVLGPCVRIRIDGRDFNSLTDLLLESLNLCKLSLTVFLVLSHKSL